MRPTSSQKNKERSMSALPQPDFSTDYSYPQPQQRIVRRPKRVNKRSLKKAKIVKSKSFPAANTLPKNLKTLSLLQKGSFSIAIATMASSIGLYFSTVNIPKQWSQEYQHLEDLQLQERQLVAINETIKYQIAQEASQDDRLTISKPESAIFINPAKVEEKKLKSDREEQDIEFEQNSWGY